MKAVFITEREYKQLAKNKLKEMQAAERKFSLRKKVHLNNTNLSVFYEQCSQEFSELLYTIPFRCYFTLYLFLFLKERVERFEFEEDKYQWTLSKPLEVNFSEIARLAKVPINTVRSAFKELTKYDFLLHSNLLTEDKNNVSKSGILVNDYWVIGHDSVKNKVFFHNLKSQKYAPSL